MISKKPWHLELQKMLRSLSSSHPESLPRLSVIGIGNELRGDDAVGGAIACALAPQAHESLQVIVAWHAPENHLGPICRFEPDLALLIDAVDMGQLPGHVEWIEWRATLGISASTHTMPPYMIGKYLQTMTGCQVALIGIQPGGMDVQAAMSEPVLQAVDTVCGHLLSLPMGRSSSPSR